MNIWQSPSPYVFQMVYECPLMSYEFFLLSWKCIFYRDVFHCPWLQHSLHTMGRSKPLYQWFFDYLVKWPLFAFMILNCPLTIQYTKKPFFNGIFYIFFETIKQKLRFLKWGNDETKSLYQILIKNSNDPTKMPKDTKKCNYPLIIKNPCFMQRAFSVCPLYDLYPERNCITKKRESK